MIRRSTPRSTGSNRQPPPLQRDRDDRGAAPIGHSRSAEERADAADLTAAIAALPQLDASALQRRWRALIGGALPKELGRPLTLRVLAYKLQAQRLGDLDRRSQRELAAALGTSAKQRAEPHAGTSRPTNPADSADNKSPEMVRAARLARPGTLLVRAYGGILHRVMVLDAGVSWNGKMYDSLSQVAFAITGTRWNGPRFFGLRDRLDGDRATKPKPDGPVAVIGRGRAAGILQSQATCARS